jgi:hypothetical protein
MRIVLHVRMGDAGTIVRIIDRETGEILDDWYDSATEGADLPAVVMSGVAFYREKYNPERVYYDVQRVDEFGGVAYGKRSMAAR